MTVKQNLVRITQRVRSEKYGQAAYFIALIVFLTALFFKSTLFIPGWTNYSFLYRIIEIDAFLVAYKVFIVDDHKLNFKVFTFLFLIALLYVQRFSRNFDIFYYSLFVIGGYKIDYRKILKIFLRVNIPLTLLTIIATLLKIIPNQLQGRIGEPGMIRYSMGFLSPTDFAARVFYLILCYLILHKMKISISAYLVCGGATYLMFCLTNARLDTLLLFLLLLTSCLFPYIQSLIVKMGHVGWYVCSCVYIAVNVFLAYFYSASNPLLARIDGLLSGRLRYGQIALHEHGITLFGQMIKEHGNGGIQHGNFEYFFVDSSFIRMFVILGLASSMLFFVVLFLLFLKFEKNMAYVLVVYVLFVLLSSAFDQHLLDPSYNVMFLALFANLKHEKIRDDSKKIFCSQ